MSTTDQSIKVTMSYARCHAIGTNTQKQCCSRGVIKYGGLCKSHYDRSLQPVKVNTKSELAKSKAELAKWMPDERERVLAATTRVLSELKKCTKENTEMSTQIESLTKENEFMTTQIKSLNEEMNDMARKQNEPVVVVKDLACPRLADEIRQLKQQLFESQQKVTLMYEDYNVYQEIRNFEEIQSILMARYMADNHYELFKMIRNDPEEAIPYLGDNPAMQYQFLRERRNKFCHPTESAKEQCSP